MMQYKDLSFIARRGETERRERVLPELFGCFLITVNI